MSLTHLWTLLRRRYLVFIIGALIGIAGAFVAVLITPKVYTSSATAYVNAGGGGSIGEVYSGTILAQVKAKNYEPMFSSAPVANKIIAKLGLQESPEAVASRISTSLPADRVIITVSARGSSPQDAQRLANAAVTATAQYVSELEKPNLSGAPLVIGIEQLSTATLPSRPSTPDPRLYLPVGAMLGLLVALLVAAGIEVRDTRLRRVEDVEKVGNASVLAVLPTSKELSALENSGQASSPSKDFATREALRKLRTNLRYINVDKAPRAVVVTSPGMAEGKSTIAANLAIVLAESGERVLLIDGDLRRPVVASRFGLDNEVGLTQVIARTVPVEEVIVPVGTTGLHVLPSGQIPPNPSELLGSERMGELLEELEKEYFVVIDAPPLLPVTDAALLAHRVGGVLMVVRFGVTRREHLERAGAAIESVGSKVLGSVLNQATPSVSQRLRYGSVEYEYGGEDYAYEYSSSRRARSLQKRRSRRRAKRS